MSISSNPTHRLIMLMNSVSCYFPDGLPIGGPLSPLLANVFMDRWEQWVLKFGRYSSCATLWYRFVDDICCIWSGTDDELHQFTADLQKYDFKLKFGVTNSHHFANYLDVSVALEPDSITAKFFIYRKTHYTGLSIHRDSLHPTSQKLSAFHSAITPLS